jgi:fermentation-respiration switch protein FrsA (DUF1100 family)
MNQEDLSFFERVLQRMTQALDIPFLFIPHFFQADTVVDLLAARPGPLSTIPARLLVVQLKPRLDISSSQLRPIDRLPNVGYPVYVLSGTEDKHTTVNETHQVFSMARQPKEMWLVDGAAHEDLYRVSPMEYESRVLGFFDHDMGKLH